MVVSTVTHIILWFELTAVEAARPVDVAGAVTKGAPKTRAVTPDHLTEVSPCRIKVWVVVGVLGLLLVPAVGSSASELDPSIVTFRGWVHGREIAAGAFLRISAMLCHCRARCLHVRGPLGTLRYQHARRWQAQYPKQGPVHNAICASTSELA